MRITKQDIRRIIKEELKKVLDEDFSILRDMTPGDAVAYMERELNGKTWVFWDLETIGFKGQISQYGAIAYKIDELAQETPPEPIDIFDVNVALSQETLKKHEDEQRVLANQEELDNQFSQAWEMGHNTSPDYELLIKIRKRHSKGELYTVQDMIDYTHYKRTENDKTEKEALIMFLNWLNSLGDNVLLVGHNIKLFDRNKIITDGNNLKVNTSSFEDMDIFDTVNFLRQLFKIIAQQQMELGNEKMLKFFDEKEKVIKGEAVKVMAFNGKLQRMIDVYGPGPDYVQLHTAIDDTKQLVTAFFKMYKEVKELSQQAELSNYAGGIDIKRAQKELGVEKDISDPLDLSRRISDFRRD